MTDGTAYRIGAAAGLSLLLAACQQTVTPVAPAGKAAYAAIATAPAYAPGESYRLQPGDVVRVSVFGEPELTQDRVMVDEAGNIALPLIGQVAAGDVGLPELDARIEAAYGARYLRDPQVSVALVEGQEQTVSVEGEVAQPGRYPYRMGDTLLVAISQARSPTEVAKLDEVLVFRTVNGQRMAGQFDLAAIRAGASADPQLMPGDVVVVGYSSVRGTYRDVLRAAPLLGIFRPF